jgi:hypothetical protein
VVAKQQPSFWRAGLNRKNLDQAKERRLLQSPFFYILRPAIDHSQWRDNLHNKTDLSKAPAKTNQRTRPLMTTRRETIARMIVMLTAASWLHGQNTRASEAIDESAKADYLAGRWKQAANQASRSRDPDNLAFAARCLLASALLSQYSRDRTTDIAQARRYAEAALITNPLHIEGRLQLATALGLQARIGSPARAFASGLPQRVRRLLDSVARDAPTQAWTFALLGGWHLEGLRIGGAAARAMLGVDLEAGKIAFARALRLDPNEAATPFYFAASLLALRPAANAVEASALLARAQATPARDAFQNEVRSRATQLSQTLAAQGPENAAKLALGWL